MSASGPSGPLVEFIKDVVKKPLNVVTVSHFIFSSALLIS